MNCDLKLSGSVVWRKLTVTGTQVQEGGLGEKRQTEWFGKCESIVVLSNIESAIRKAL